MVTLSQVAAKAGVSLGAASVVLRDDRATTIRVSAAAAKRVRLVAAALGYRPSAASRAMRSSRTRQVGVLLPNRPGHEGASPMSFETIQGINDGFQSAGYVLTLVRMHDVLNDLTSGSRVFREQVLDGVIVLGSMPPGVESWLARRFEHVVWCDADVWNPTRCVRRDEVAAGRLAAGALLRAGYRRVVWAGVPAAATDHYSRAERLRGATEATLAAGGELVALDVGEHLRWEDLGGGDVAVIAGSHPVAELVCLAAMRARQVPGEDFSLASCDDPHYTAWTWRRLSRVEFNRFDMGRLAASMLLDALSASDQEGVRPSIRLNCRWIEGETVKKGVWSTKGVGHLARQNGQSTRMGHECSERKGTG
jgi:LacI family transcriptional regulator